MEKSKRIRASNWETEEKALLTEIIMKRIDRLENKSVDKTSNLQKRQAWEETVAEFNSLNQYRKRDLAQIMAHWRNTKNNLKKKDEQTGGGPPSTPPKNEDQDLIDPLPGEFEIYTNFYENGSITQTSNVEEENKKTLFLLAKKEREQRIKHSEEEHNMKMRLMALEEEYWLKKIKNCDPSHGSSS